MSDFLSLQKEKVEAPPRGVNSEEPEQPAPIYRGSELGEAKSRHYLFDLSPV
jgi:hypothetical protein